MVTINYVAWLADFMESYGISPEQLLQETGLSNLDLENPQKIITDAQHVQLLRSALRLSRDPALGLAAGYNRHISTLDQFGFAMMCCETYQEALRLGFKYQHVVGGFSGRKRFLSSHEEANTAVIQIATSPELGDLALFAVEDILGAILAGTRWFTGKSLPLLELRCAYPAPAHASVYQKYFRCPIQFDATHNQVRFESAFLSTRLPFASRNAAAVYRTHCQQMDEQEASETDAFLSKVRAQIMQGGGQVVSLEECAAALLISTRTLRRKLCSRGVSYQDIVDEVRGSIARSYLLTSKLTIRSIAERLGFSEPTSFSRAFKRWTGQSPREYRSVEPALTGTQYADELA